jgi:O-antigen/teichoic acid export membrane protein
VALAIISTAPIFFSNFGSRVLLGLGQIAWMNWIRILQAVLRAALVVVLVWMLPWGLDGAIWAYLTAYIVSALIAVLASFRSVGLEWKIDVSFLRLGFLYGIPSFLLLLGNFLNHRFDLFFVKHYLGAADVGLYSVAVAWLDRFLYLPQAAGTVLFPRVASTTGSSSQETVMRAARHSIAVVLVGGAVFIALAAPFIRILYGHEYLGSVPALYALLPGVVMLSLFQVYVVAIAADGRPGVGAIASIVAFVTNCLLNVIWIPRYGIVGAGLATTASYGLMATISVLAYRRLYGVSLRDMIFLRPSEAATMMSRVATRIRRRKRTQ